VVEPGADYPGPQGDRPGRRWLPRASSPAPPGQWPCGAHCQDDPPRRGAPAAAVHVDRREPRTFTPAIVAAAGERRWAALRLQSRPAPQPHHRRAPARPRPVWLALAVFRDQRPPVTGSPHRPFLRGKAFPGRSRPGPGRPGPPRLIPSEVRRAACPSRALGYLTVSKRNVPLSRAPSRRYLKSVSGVHDVAGRAFSLRRGHVILSGVYDAAEAVAPA